MSAATLQTACRRRIRVGRSRAIKARRQESVRAALEAARGRESFTITDIAGAVALSKTTVKQIVDGLLSMGLLVSAGKGPSSEEGGKRPELYRFNADYGYIISIHVAPDRIISATTDLTANVTGSHTVRPVPDRDLDAVIAHLSEIVNSSVAERATTPGSLAGIAVALPGLVDAESGVSIFSPHYPNWGRDVPFRQKLVDALADRDDVPIFVDCVNRFQAIAEGEKGVARGVANYIIIDALDEGLGAGIVAHGELVRGTQSLSGEIGHMTLDPREGPRCICGNVGCFEAMVSAKRIQSLVEDGLHRGVPSALTGKPGDGGASSTIGRVCELANGGDPLGLSIVEDIIRWFTIGIGNIIMVNDPELVVIQGDYVRAGAAFLSRLRSGLRTIGLPEVEKRVEIAFSRLGDDRGVIGAAGWVARDYFARRLSFTRF